MKKKTLLLSLLLLPIIAWGYNPVTSEIFYKDSGDVTDSVLSVLMHATSSVLYITQVHDATSGGSPVWYLMCDGTIMHTGRLSSSGNLAVESTTVFPTPISCSGGLNVRNSKINTGADIYVSVSGFVTSSTTFDAAQQAGATVNAYSTSTATFSPTNNFSPTFSPVQNFYSTSTNGTTTVTVEGGGGGGGMAYDGPNLQEYLFVGGVQIFCLSMMVWSKVGSVIV